jgi:chromosome segregation ATPase
VTFAEGGSVVDLVECIRPFPQPDQTAEIERLKTEWQVEFAAAQQLRFENGQLKAEIARLQTEWQTEFSAAQQLRSEVQQLERLLDEAREELQQLQADQAADEQHSEGERAAYVGMIKALWEMRR